MRFYPQGSAVPFSIAHVNDMGDAIDPDNVVVELRDGGGNRLALLEADVSGDASTGMVPGTFNDADPSGDVAVRVIVARMTGTDGVVVERSVVYGVEPSEVLRVCVNSFQTLPQAQVEGVRLVNLVAFNSEESELRQSAALAEAYERIITRRLTYAVTVGGREHWHRLNADSWAEMTEDAFNTQLPSALRRALRHAQLVEADEILQGNVMARKHAAGIQHETIGESSVTLRAGVGSVGGMSSFASKILAPFLDNTVRIGRS